MKQTKISIIKKGFSVKMDKEYKLYMLTEG